jgi:hypothetical protein
MSKFNTVLIIVAAGLLSVAAELTAADSVSGSSVAA